jgi:hypothetical protein
VRSWRETASGTNVKRWKENVRKVLRRALLSLHDKRLWKNFVAGRTEIDLAQRCIPTWPYVAPQTAKIHTLITLGIRHRSKAPIFELRKRLPCGFDSHRPLHFSLSGVSLRCPRTRRVHGLVPTVAMRLQPAFGD